MSVHDMLALLSDPKRERWNWSLSSWIHETPKLNMNQKMHYQQITNTWLRHFTPISSKTVKRRRRRARDAEKKLTEEKKTAKEAAKKVKKVKKGEVEAAAELVEKERQSSESSATTTTTTTAVMSKPVVDLSIMRENIKRRKLERDGAAAHAGGWNIDRKGTKVDVTN